MHKLYNAQIQNRRHKSHGGEIIPFLDIDNHVLKNSDTCIMHKLYNEQIQNRRKHTCNGEVGGGCSRSTVVA